MTRRRVHLLVGHSFILQVVPPYSSAKVEIAAEPPLQAIVPASRVEGGRLPTYHAEFCGRLHLRIIPIPSNGKLHVTIIDGLPDPRQVTIPITVWPAYSTLALWWLFAFLSIVGLRWQRVVANGESLPDMLRAMWGDLPFLLLLLAFGLLIVYPLRLMYWLIVLLAESARENY